MKFDLESDERAFAEEVEAFLNENASPDVMDPHPEQLSQTVDTPAKRAFIGKLAERGWLGMSWPKEYGGREMSGIYDFVLTEALARRGAPQPGKGVGIVGKTLIRHGSDKMKSEVLPKILRGEIEFAIGYSEPDAGSDAASMRLKAERKGDGWVLNGAKLWTTSAHFADWYWVGARTDPDSKHKGITLFLIPMKHPGLSIRPIWTIGDERTNEVFFENVEVSADMVVGEVNHGWTYICEALDLERFAMMPIGGLEKKVEALCAHAHDAEVSGRRLREDPIVRHQIARLVTELEVSRMLQARVISSALKDKIPTIQSSQYKLFMNECGQHVADAALDLLGPDGVLRPGEEGALLDGKFERSYRYTVVDTIGGGASEIQKNIIATRGLGLPKNF
ncbi:MAG: acyl-CoA dehydrogenase family protein [Candidatus Binatia bacterium]|nr:acyl-CoA dehydrogenase family protein [Candidatus Binatia bacterium]